MWGYWPKRINEQNKDKLATDSQLNILCTLNKLGTLKKLESNFAAVKIHILCRRRYNCREDDYI